MSRYRRSGLAKRIHSGKVSIEVAEQILDEERDRLRAAFKASGLGKKAPGAKTKAGLRRLEAALCTLADYESELTDALSEVGDGASAHDLGHVCAALRLLVDGEEG
jgi:hypothetical protein